MLYLKSWRLCPDDYTEVVSRQRYRGESELVEFIKNYD